MKNHHQSSTSLIAFIGDAFVARSLTVLQWLQMNHCLLHPVSVSSLMGMISSSTFHLIMPSLMISPLDNAIFNSLVPDNAILSQLFERSTLLPLPTLVIFKICFTSCYASSLRYTRPVFCVHGQSPASSSLDARTPLMARTGLSFIGPFGT